MRTFLAHLATAWVLGLAATSAWSLDLANQPLFLTVGVKPNIFFVLDDSGSMDWDVLLSTEARSLHPSLADSDAYPGRYFFDGDSSAFSSRESWPISNDQGALENCAGYNVLAYNPDVTYRPWKGSDEDGNTYWNRTLTTACYDPYDTDSCLPSHPDYVDLRDQVYFVWNDTDGAGDGSGLGVYEAGECLTPYSRFAELSSGDQITPALCSQDPALNCVAAEDAGAPTGVDGQTNFANWYTYYRKREYVLKRAASEVIATSGFRMGISWLNDWINDPTRDPPTETAPDASAPPAPPAGPGHDVFKSTAIRDMTGATSDICTGKTDKDCLLDRLLETDSLCLYRDPFIDDNCPRTPLRRALDEAGKYFSIDGRHEYLPATETTPILPEAEGGSCQQNFAILISDGFWNQSGPVPASRGDADSVNPSQYGGGTHADAAVGSAPNCTRPAHNRVFGNYVPIVSDTLADIAMHFYETDLAPTLPPEVPTAGADENPEQHMVTFTVAFGIDGTITENPPCRDASDCTAGQLATYSNYWPPICADEPTAVDDMRHAAWNGRGKFLSAKRPTEVSDRLIETIKTITDTISSSSASAANSTSLQTDTQIYQARFDPRDWSGQLLAFDIGLTGTVSDTPSWDAGEVINGQTAAGRKIVTYSRDSNDGIPFTWTAIDGLTDTTQADFLDTDPATGLADGRGSDRVDFLRGDTSITDFRSRSSKLGDIVNSGPFYVGAPGAGYPDATYTQFMTDNEDRDPILYVGANDGMLHGFDADTGEERIAYVPEAVYENLNQLTDPDYAHRYFVDGSVLSADVELGTDDWKTIVAGGLNGGGRGYYALDVTDPSLFADPSANAAGLVLWEYTHEDDPDLGFTYNQPPINFATRQSAQIAKMNNEAWAIIVGNGYNSTGTGTASLFVLFIAAGADGSWDTGDVVKIDTGAGTLVDIDSDGTGDIASNGLSTPMPEDIDGDGDVDIAYAGDLEGNVWKFDLTDTSPSNWGVARLYTPFDGSGDLDPQPITTAPLVVPHPDGGYMVGFGTGKYLEVNDGGAGDTGVQSLYGIWDNNGSGGVTSVVRRTDLVEQEISVETAGTGVSYRVLTDNPVDYSTVRGWYVDLPSAGERVAFNPIARTQRFIFATQIPSQDPCSAGGSGWLMEADYLTGGRFAEPPFDVDENGVINSGDLVDVDLDNNPDTADVAIAVSGFESTVGVPTTPIVLSKDDRTEIKVVCGTSGDCETVDESKSVRSGRISWKQLLEE
jgi:type IV pilus assembly protein PilY1